MTREKLTITDLLQILLVLAALLFRFLRNGSEKRISHKQYHRYLQSPEWQALRVRVKKRDNWQCQLCGSGKSLHVHHRTYDRLGHERLSDLVTLCSQCHSKFHDKTHVTEVK